MIRVRYSNRIEQLVDALAGALPPPGDVGAMFDGPWLVIPSRPLELYVDLELARRRGISGNVDTMSVRGAFARLCVQALPDVTLIDRGHLVGELLALLSDEGAIRGNPACADIQAYLLGAGTQADAVNRRRVDVARALGSLFDDWTWSRPELLARWRRGADGGDGGDARDGGGTTRGAAALARAERALWEALFGRGGRFQRRGEAEGRHYLTIDALLAENLDDAWQPPPAIHFFALSELPRGLQLGLARLGNRTAVEIYAVNPCREFWEDLETRPLAMAGGAARPVGPLARRRGSAAASKKNIRQLEFAALAGDSVDAATYAAEAPAAAAHSDGENPFLRVWGQAGRESTKLLNQLSDGDFESAFVVPAGGTVLARVQSDILDRQPGRGGAGALNLEPDHSLLVRGAPNPRRELETIAAEIWALVRADATLRFSDIALVIAGSDDPYLALARAVFKEARDLPHSIVDQPIASGSHLVEAVLALLALPLGTFTRREVLDIITHPNVRARFPETDPSTWLRLCEGLAIAHGADQLALADTYIDGDLFNWDQGLKRVALGLFARGPRSGVEDGIILPLPQDEATRSDDGAQVAPPRQRTDGAAAYVPADLAPDVRSDADALALLVRSLLADARFARSARLSLRDWTGFARALMSSYVVPVTPDDEQARLRLFTALDQIATEAPPDLVVPLGPALELLRGALTGLRGTRGQMLGGGVTVGTISALRALPFRIIFVAGLDANRFPAADRPSPFEVMADHPRAGDVTPRQQDRYRFLETLLAARDSVVFSYVDRDAVTGELREPSPLLLELLEQLQRGYLRSDAAVVRRVPLHRDEDPRLHDAFPAAAAEGRARLAGASLRETVPAAAGLPAHTILRALSPAVRHGVSLNLRRIALEAAGDHDLGDHTGAGKLPLVGPGAPATRPTRSRPRVLRIIDLRRFLECPLQGSARIFLGLRDLPDDTAARETADEPFEVPRAVERQLLGTVFGAAWMKDARPDIARLPAIYDGEVARHAYARLFPTGLFRDNVRRRHLRILDQWVESLAIDGSSARRGPLRRVCFGRPEPFSPPCERRSTIRLTVDLPGQGPTPIEIHGLTEPQLLAPGDGDRNGAGGSLVLATSFDRENNDKDSLRAFLDHVALAASRGDDQPARRFDAVICRPARDGSAGPPHLLSWEPLSTETARAYLTALVTELLSGVHGYLFPCEAVFRSFNGQMSLVDRIDQVRADRFYREHSSSTYGPVPDPFDYPTPSAALAEQYAAARFGMLRAWFEAQPRPKSKRGAW